MLDEVWVLSDLSEGEALMITFYIQVEYDSEATPMRQMATTAILLFIELFRMVAIWRLAHYIRPQP